MREPVDARIVDNRGRTRRAKGSRPPERAARVHPDASRPTRRIPFEQLRALVISSIAPEGGPEGEIEGETQHEPVYEVEDEVLYDPEGEAVYRPPDEPEDEAMYEPGSEPYEPEDEPAHEFEAQPTPHRPGLPRVSTLDQLIAALRRE
jgi:hypothetical protein